MLIIKFSPIALIKQTYRTYQINKELKQPHQLFMWLFSYNFDRYIKVYDNKPYWKEWSIDIHFYPFYIYYLKTR